MAPKASLSEYVETCTRIGDEVADEQGFVAIRRLLQRFGTQLQLRPLLVEAMFASLEPTPGRDSSKERWTVLLDSETYGVDLTHIDEESSQRPLPDRFRNSVAHELVHSLAFRQSEFGLRLRQDIQDVGIEELEHATEALSPLVLIAERALAQRVRAIQRRLTVNDLVAWRRDWGVSRYVLLSRLSRLSRDHPLRQLQGLRNCAAGIATWESSDSPVLLGWPLYVNFDRNVQPRFLAALAAREQLPLTAINGTVARLPSEQAPEPVTWDTPAGVVGSETSTSMTVTLTLEPGSYRSGARYFWVISTT